MGYTPLFDTLTKGTLCGRWPDIGLWPVVLSLADRHGVVDCTPAFIAGVTGLALDDVVACMKRFCGPDAYSRSPVASGARLELLDLHREWGWRIVNFDHYREKSRKAAYDADRVASGKDAERKRDERAQASRDVPTRPDASRALPLSDSDSDSDKDSRRVAIAPAPLVLIGEVNGRRSTKRASRFPEDFTLTTSRARFASDLGLSPQNVFEKFADYWRGVSGSKGTKLDWDATWRNWCRSESERNPRKSGGPDNGLPTLVVS